MTSFLAAHVVYCHDSQMLKNRSVPVDTVLPHMAYQNVAEVVEWLTRTFGFIEQYRYGGDGDAASGAQMRLGNAWLFSRHARDVSREEWGAKLA
jgi:hypothetical protein